MTSIVVFKSITILSFLFNAPLNKASIATCAAYAFVEATDTSTPACNNTV